MKKAILGALFVGALFASCSSDEPGTNPDPVNGEYSYLAVNIVTPKESTGSQMHAPTETPAYELGSEAEDAASTGVFILFNEFGKVSLVTPPQTLDPWQGISNSYDHTVENISSAVILVENQQSNTTPTSLLAILNAPANINTKITVGQTMADVEKIIDNYATTGAQGSFIMTNSVYLDEAGTKQIAANTTGKFAKSREEAKNNPVDIYVERVVAKIRTKADNNGFKIKDDQTVTLKGSQVNVKINVTGVEVANVAKTSYLFKNINGFTATTPWNGWTDPTNMRSYWAVTPADLEYENHSWNAISNDVNAEHNFYVQENVFTGSTTPVQNTAVLVTAQLTYKDGVNKDQPLQLVKIGDLYYTMEDGLTHVVQSLNNRHYFIKTGDNKYESIPLDYFEWATSAPAAATDVKGWEGFVQLKADKKNVQYYQYDSSVEGDNKYVEKTGAQIDAVLCEKILRVKKWTDGKCYYFVDIEHFGTDAEGNKLKGIIRNHIYDLNLQSLGGLGVPVFDPTVDIIPEVPGDDQFFYLSARINILRWRIVSQDVNFNN